MGSVSSALKISTVESLPLAMEVSHRASPIVFLVNLFLSTLFLWTHYVCLFQTLVVQKSLELPLAPISLHFVSKEPDLSISVQSDLYFVCMCEAT